MITTYPLHEPSYTNQSLSLNFNFLSIKLLHEMLDKICTDLKISRKLKELGIKAETKFYWELDHINGVESIGCWFKEPLDNPPHYEYVSAYTLETILEIIGADTININILNLDIHYIPLFESPNNQFEDYSIERKDDESLVNTAARLLIKLKQDKII